MEKRVSKLVSRFKQIGDEHIRGLPIYHRPLQVERWISRFGRRDGSVS
jgi:hypothetical protein